LIGLLSSVTVAMSLLLFFKRRKAKDTSIKHTLLLIQED
jgi:hypothetical protein